MYITLYTYTCIHAWYSCTHTHHKHAQSYVPLLASLRCLYFSADIMSLLDSFSSNLCNVWKHSSWRNLPRKAPAILMAQHVILRQYSVHINLSTVIQLLCLYILCSRDCIHKAEWIWTMLPMTGAYGPLDHVNYISWLCASFFFY